jgi:hypothetical protein
VDTSASTIQLVGAAGFGALIGWYVYYINRYRKSEVSLNDLVTLIGVLGGGTILAIFPERTDLFGAYGIGLFVGFFSYFFFLLGMVGVSKNFNVEWFLDGRRKRPAEPYYIPDDKVGGTAMAMPKEEGGKTTVND